MDLEKRILLCKRVAEIQADATERVVRLADELGLNRDETLEFMALGFTELCQISTLKDYIPRSKE